VYEGRVIKTKTIKTGGENKKTKNRLERKKEKGTKKKDRRVNLLETNAM
jgi:hypothetical protein